MASGLQGLKGFRNDTPEATPEQRLGGTVDPRHSAVGEVAEPYAYEQFPNQPHGPYGLENELFGMDIASFIEPAGQLGQDPTADMTPVRGHAAPWPKGVPTTNDPDVVSERRAELAGIHSSDMGGWKEYAFIPTADPTQDDWQLIDETDPGLGFPQQEEIPGQIKTGGSAGWGSRDRVQSYAGQNAYGFDSAHIRRRYAAGSIPGNYQWMEPGSRPLQKTIPGTAILPTGPDSPFYGQDGDRGYDSYGSALATLPTQYEPPVEPALAAALPSFEAPSVDLW